MFSRIRAFFRVTRICAIIAKVKDGLSSAIVVFTHLKEQVEGSEIGNAVTPMLTQILEALEAFKNGAQRVSEIVCPASVSAQRDVRVPVEEAAHKLDEAIANINDLLKR